MNECSKCKSDLIQLFQITCSSPDSLQNINLFSLEPENKSLASVPLISSHLLSLPFHLSPCCFQRYSELFSLRTLSCTWTHSACKVQTKSNVNLKAQSHWDNKRLHPRIRGVPRQTSPTLRTPSSSPSISLPPPRPSLLCPLRANLASALQALCKMLVYQLSLPPQRKSDYNSNTVSLYLCLCLFVSALSVSTHTGLQTHLFLSTFFFFVPFPSLKAKWSEHPSCIVSLGAKELRGLPKCQIYNSPLLGHTASGHVSAFLLTLFSPEPLFLPQTTTPPQIHLYNLIAQVYKNG